MSIQLIPIGCVENKYVSRRHTQTYADKRDFLPGRPVFASGFAAAGLCPGKSFKCLSGISVIIIPINRD